MSTASFQAVGDEGRALEAATHTELHGRDDPAQNDRAKRALLLRSGPRRVSGSHGLKRLVSIEQSSLIDSDERRGGSSRFACCPDAAHDECATSVRAEIGESFREFGAGDPD